MGEIADMMLEGDLCAGCGGYIDGDGPGAPRYCSDSCREELESEETALDHDYVRCNACGKKVKAVGLRQHMADKHGGPSPAKPKPDAPKGLRDEMAMAALPAALETLRLQKVYFDSAELIDAHKVAAEAYRIADSMMRARKS